MASHILRLLEDRLGPDKQLQPPLMKLHRVIFVAEGDMTVKVGKDSRYFAANQAWFGTESPAVTAGKGGAKLWRWELVDKMGSDEARNLGDSDRPKLKLSADITLDPTEQYLIRCDRVDFPLGGVAYTHTHAGPGIRCLYRGKFMVSVNGHQTHLDPGAPWFEAGPDPVYAEASKTELTSFIRTMVLPARLKGQSSIKYVKDEDRDKPKTQTYTRFVDDLIDLKSAI
ncbi:MAG: hypothetical protein FJ319_06715 [SAR202 cluster bacterium]|nr:hypothetical protein [SAR202 cluster bacterium]